MKRRPVGVDIAQDLGDSGGKIVSSYEAEELEKSGLARDIQECDQDFELDSTGIVVHPRF